MRKKLAILLVCLFALTFAMGALVSTAQAKLPCTAACINGMLRVCCYNAQGVYTCNWRGPCFIDF